MIRAFTAFSGYDSQCLALDRLAADFPEFAYELVGWSEIDKYAIRAHDALYPQWAARNYGDISKVDWAQVPDFDLFTYSWPCTDVSVAGAQRGMAEGSGTRSSLLWECRRAIEAKRPRMLVAENVPAVVGKKNRPHFDRWLSILAGMGYRTEWRILNAEDCGVAQHRKRLFAVSRLGSEPIAFPDPIPLNKCVCDYCDEEVSPDLFLSGDRLQRVASTLDASKLVGYFAEKGCSKVAEQFGVPFSGGRVYSGEQSAATVRINSGHAEVYAMPLRVVGNHYGSKHSAGRVYEAGGSAPTLRAAKPERLYAACVSCATRTRSYMGRSESLEMGGGTANALTTVGKDSMLAALSFVGYTRSSHGAGREISFHLNPTANVVHGSTGSGRNTDQYIAAVCQIGESVQIPCAIFSHQGQEYALFVRKLSPSEAFRLMDVPEPAIASICQSGIPKSQQYKLAGNSIVVSCLYRIFKSNLTNQPNSL